VDPPPGCWPPATGAGPASSAGEGDEHGEQEEESERIRASPLPEPRRARGASLTCAANEDPAVEERATRVLLAPNLLVAPALPLEPESPAASEGSPWPGPSWPLESQT